MHRREAVLKKAHEALSTWAAARSALRDNVSDTIRVLGKLRRAQSASAWRAFGDEVEVVRGDILLRHAQSLDDKLSSAAVQVFKS
jgi:hypothetical protein